MHCALDQHKATPSASSMPPSRFVIRSRAPGLWRSTAAVEPTRLLARNRPRARQVLVREPGSIGGQQFIVDECTSCDAYLLDHTAALTIDACTDCRIFTGPCESR